MEWSAGLKPRAVAGKLSVTRLTQSSCTGIKASGMPSTTVKKMLTTSPMLEETMGETFSHLKKIPIKKYKHTEITDKLLRVIIDQTTFFNCFLNSCKV